ncbi:MULTISPECIES: hypothetical protein [unclassified Caballeronia]|uniref:hypothetical protein n=1 Tax=unclassified Caballeronia TaxID=2646786 RepID=UPI00202958C9|nr:MULTISPECIES: hypothetical protein [unclassified Caballeronia]MDR5765832.1 hypothetical protein [Caballeronia sp. LZ028]
MDRKLTKRTRGTDQLMVRREGVEEELHELRKLGSAELIQRIRGSTANGKTRLSSETVMALLRDGQPEQAEKELIVCIIRRFSSVAAHKLRIRDCYSQEALENVLGAFNEALVTDLTTHGEKLDFFEASFSHAVAGFIHSEVRREKSRRKRLVSMTPADDEQAGSDDTDAFVDVDPPLLRRSNPESAVFTQDLLTAIGELPRALREVAILLGLGVQKESDDPNETTIATICQIKRRAILYRQEQIIEKLAHFQE